MISVVSHMTLSTVPSRTFLRSSPVCLWHFFTSSWWHCGGFDAVTFLILPESINKGFLTITRTLGFLSQLACWLKCLRGCNYPAVSPGKNNQVPEFLVSWPFNKFLPLQQWQLCHDSCLATCKITIDYKTHSSFRDVLKWQETQRWK